MNIIFIRNIRNFGDTVHHSHYIMDTYILAVTPDQSVKTEASLNILKVSRIFGNMFIFLFLVYFRLFDLRVIHETFADVFLAL